MNERELQDALNECSCDLSEARYRLESAVEEVRRLEVTVAELLAVAKCEEALDGPHESGVAILRSHGWDYENRFDCPATAFVRGMRRAAIAKAERKI